RIQGELKGLGISVSHTTIATVLRSAGLGPAPRRIGPRWGEFLRAQAQSLLGSELWPVGADGLHGALREGSEPAHGRQVCEVAAVVKLAQGAAPPFPAHPVPARHRAARRPCVSRRGSTPGAPVAIASIACARRTSTSGSAVVVTEAIAQRRR